jgi:hypothetical protein
MRDKNAMMGIERSGFRNNDVIEGRIFALLHKSPLTFSLSDSTVFDPEAQIEGRSSQASLGEGRPGQRGSENPI